jgi:hypothetical protein
MKFVAIWVFTACALITAYTASTFARPPEEKSQWPTPETAIFLFVFFGLAAMILPIVLTMPKSGSRESSDESHKVQPDSRIL